MCLAGEQKSVLVMVLLPSIVAGSRDLHTKKTSYSVMQDIYIKKQKVVLCSQTHQDRSEMGFSAQMGLKSDVYAREVLHATARKIALEKNPLNFLCVMNI